jgi:bifunctional DNA-binding transcriptional regulator/antitoxin component of YhaV-PrlF toxin-antitoxin module
MATNTVTKIDRSGRVYLPRAIRKAARIGADAVLDLEAHEGEVILRRRTTSIAEKSRGLFKLRIHVEDLDRVIHTISAEEMEKELDEIRRR